MDTFKSNNPILRNLGVCDPHIHIFQNRAYLYASHDYSADNETFCMKDWQIWSSDDLVHWSLESTIHPEDTFMGKSDDCWAVDAAYKNGKYYYYYSNGNKSTGVMVSNDPGKYFKEARKDPLLYEGLCPTKGYDPAVFIDDDGIPYIIFGTPVWAGGDSYYIARLMDNMTELAEPPKKICLNHPADDKPWLHKYKKKYYLSWASHYAVSDHIYGPYEYVGNLGVSEDHGSFFEWNNQWFKTFTIFDNTKYYRASGICYIHYKADGSMVFDEVIGEYGVGQYNAEWNRIKSVWYMAASPEIIKVENVRNGFDLANICDGGFVYFPNIHNIRKDAQIMFYVANPNEDPVTIEVHEDKKDGPILGQVTVEKTPLWEYNRYKAVLCELKNEPGKKNLYFVFRGKGKDMIRFSYFKFDYNRNYQEVPVK